MIAVDGFGPLVDCPECPPSGGCPLCLDVGVVHAVLLYPHELPDSAPSGRVAKPEPRLWTDLAEPPVTAWWTMDDSWRLAALLGAVVGVIADGLRAPFRCRWGP